MRAQFYTYPIKSTQGLNLLELTADDPFVWDKVISQQPLPFDRAFMLIDAKTYRFLSQRIDRELKDFRTGHKLATIRTLPFIDNDNVYLSVETPEGKHLLDDEDNLHFKEVNVTVHNDKLTGLDWDDDAADFFSSILKYDCRLVEARTLQTRPEFPNFNGSRADVLGYADQYPMTIANEASWEKITEQEKDLTDVGVDRFRANIVLSGFDAFEEDNILTLRIGEAELELVKPCSRCPIPNIDQKTGQRHGKVSAALMRANRIGEDGKHYFAWNAFVRKEGHIGDGRDIEILTKRSEPHPMMSGVTNTAAAFKL